MLIGGQKKLRMNSMKSLFHSKISGFYRIDFNVVTDVRGSFNQWFSDVEHTEIGIFPRIKQANMSTSVRGVVRGIHFSNPTHPQYKLVTCTNGSIIDYGVDLRKSSPTYGNFDYFELNENNGNTVILESGIGHAFEVLSESATIVYLLSEVWKPDLEYTINVFDDDINIPWKTKNPILSDRDKSALVLKDFKSTVDFL